MLWIENHPLFKFGYALNNCHTRIDVFITTSYANEASYSAERLKLGIRYIYCRIRDRTKTKLLK